jgi:hypothetical protein
MILSFSRVVFKTLFLIFCFNVTETCLSSHIFKFIYPRCRIVYIFHLGNHVFNFRTFLVISLWVLCLYLFILFLNFNWLYFSMLFNTSFISSNDFLLFVL